VLVIGHTKLNGNGDIPMSKLKFLKPKPKKEITEADKKIAREKAKNAAEAKITPKRGNKGKGQPISETAIKEAKSANALDAMQRRIDDLPKGVMKKAMQRMLDAQRTKFESGQAADVDRAARASTQANRDRKMKDKVTLGQSFEGFKRDKDFEKAEYEYDANKEKGMNKGSLVQPKEGQTGLKKLPSKVRNKMGYMNRGGLTKSGSTDMRKGGMFYK